MSLVGKFVFLERKDPTKDKSSYHDGEYVVIRETPHSVYGVKPSPGYDGARHHMFSKHEYRIHDPYVDPVALRSFRDELNDFADTPRRGEKLRWIESVYSDARNVVRQLDRICASQGCCASSGHECPNCGVRLNVVAA